MEISKALEIASLLAKGINPKTREPFEGGKSLGNAHLNTNKVRQPSNSSPHPQSVPTELTSVQSSQSHLQSPVARKHMYQVSEALIRLMADVHHRGPQFELLDDYLARRRKECMPSLRMIGIDNDNGWALIQAHWTIQYWQERAIRAELLLKDAK